MAVAITCNCFDRHSDYKHILFLLSSTEMLTYVDMGSVTIHIPTFIQKLSTSSLKYHELDAHMNKLCVSTNTTVRNNMCSCELRHDLSICVRCFGGVCHKECASGATPECSFCSRPRHFVHVTMCKSGFWDFTELISHFRWPLGNIPHSSTDPKKKRPSLQIPPPPDQLMDPQAVLVTDSPSISLDLPLPVDSISTS